MDNQASLNKVYQDVVNRYQLSINYYPYKSYLYSESSTKDIISQQHKQNIINNARNGASVVARDTFSYLPRLIIKFATLLATTASPLIALQRSLEQISQETYLPPAHLDAFSTGILQALEFLKAYAITDIGMMQDIKNFEALVVASLNNKLGTKIQEIGISRVGLMIQSILKFIDKVLSVANQLKNNLIGKSESQIIDAAQNTKEKPVGLWGRITNWIKKKLGRNKSFATKGMVYSYIASLGCMYHISGTASILLSKIVALPIMNTSTYEAPSQPSNIDYNMVANSIQEMKACFDCLSADAMPGLDYISIKLKLDNLISYANAYVNIMGQQVDSKFKVVEIRAIFRLLINKLRDLVTSCMAISPDPIMYDV